MDEITARLPENPTAVRSSWNHVNSKSK